MAEFKGSNTEPRPPEISCPMTRLRCLRTSCGPKCEGTGAPVLHKLNIAAMRSEAERECGLRKSVYPRLVASKKAGKAA